LYTIARLLHVSVDRATDLHRRCGIRHPNPSALVTVNDKVVAYTAKVIKEVNPIWDRTFDIDVTRSSKVAVKVYDELDSEKKDLSLIGEAEMNITDIFKSPCHEQSSTYSLKKPKHSKSTGTIKVTIDPTPDRDVLADIQSAASKATTQAQQGVESTVEFYK